MGVTSTVAALAVGLVLGLAAAYFGGIVDAILMRIADIQLSFPAILIALVLLAMLGQGVDKIIVALVAVQWAYYARTVRSAALVERQKEYVEAAQVLALSRTRIVFRHMLPNCLPPLIVVATLELGLMILFEAGLSFLGLGIQPPTPSWGGIMAVGRNYLASAWWIATLPGLCLFLVVLAVNLLGDQLRDRFDPRSSVR